MASGALDVEIQPLGGVDVERLNALDCQRGRGSRTHLGGVKLALRVPAAR